MTAIVLAALYGLLLGHGIGHRRGWYHGYDARKYETFEGENWVPRRMA